MKDFHDHESNTRPVKSRLYRVPQPHGLFPATRCGESSTSRCFCVACCGASRDMHTSARSTDVGAWKDLHYIACIDDRQVLKPSVTWTAMPVQFKPESALSSRGGMNIVACYPSENLFADLGFSSRRLWFSAATYRPIPDRRFYMRYLDKGMEADHIVASVY